MEEKVKRRAIDFEINENPAAWNVKARMQNAEFWGSGVGGFFCEEHLRLLLSVRSALWKEYVEDKGDDRTLIRIK